MVLSASQLFTAPLLELKKTLLDLLCTDAYKVGDFTLSSGLKSSYYINCKPVTLNPLGAVCTGRLMFDQLHPGTDCVAGLTLGADPVVSAVSLVSAYADQPLPGLIIRKEAKGHGTRAYIEGPSLPTGSTVAVLEDVVTTGGSALKAVERLQAAGYQVSQVLAIVDREQGGAETYQKRGLAFDSLFKITDVQARWAERSSS